MISYFEKDDMDNYLYEVQVDAQHLENTLS